MMRKALHPIFLLLLGLLLVMLPQLLVVLFLQSPQEVAQKSGRIFEKKFQELQLALEEMKVSLEQGNTAGPIAYYETQRLGLYRFSGDSLVFWNNSRLNPEREFERLKPGRGFFKFSHGYYVYILQSQGNFADLAVCLVKPDYQIQNNYLKNDFLSWTGLNNNLSLSQDSLSDVQVKADGQWLFSFKTQEVAFTSPAWINACSIAFLTGLLLLLWVALKWNEHHPNRYRWIGLLAAMALLRLSISIFKWPGLLYQSILYDVREYGDAGSFLNTYLGDLLLNAVFLLFGAALLYRRVLKTSDRRERIAIKMLLGVLLLFSFFQFNYSIPTLIQNSTLSFDFLSVFNMKPLAITGVAIIGLGSLPILVALKGWFTGSSQETKNALWTVLPAVLLIGAVHFWFTGQQSVVLSFWLLLPALGFGWMLRSTPQSFTYALIVFVLICSVAASYFFTLYLEKNQQAELKLISYRLSERQDPALENEYKALPEKIAGDQRLKNLVVLLPNTRLEIAQLLKQNYFNAYFDRYSLEFVLFDANCTPLLDPSNSLYWNQGYFEDQLKVHSDSTLTEGLYFVRDHKSGTRYISRLSIGENNLFVVMDAKELGEQGSFPDLLLDESQQKQEKFGNLSYAVYRSDRLVNHFGEFNYPHFTPDAGTLEEDKNTFRHYLFEPEAGTRVVISEKIKTTTERFTYNSYFFLIFSFMGFVCYYGYRFIFERKLASATLTQRIQVSIIVLLLLAMTAVGLTSGKLVTRQFENESKKDLSIKSTIILNELLSQFSPGSLFDGSRQELINQRIKEYARIFNSDLSLFNARGKLVNTSQPKLYELGLSADLVHPSAFYSIQQNRAYPGTVMESAGQLKYFSYYDPVYGDSKQLLGFINLPYFAKQSGLTRELSGIISALINVYLVLFLLSLVSGLVLSRYITQPLRIIKQQIARIRLGQRNENIQWQSNDEIGKLVYEYNQMLLKLEESATRLAQSERESAWREMAKQVAHEIKNPLTPMKLNIQYLQHLQQSSPEDFKLKFEQASAGIIEQIDALATIATEFSHFAKLPGPELQEIDPLEILQNSVQLFNKLPRLNVEFHCSVAPVKCKGDKEQCMRVFNNILSNAVEALEDREDPKITIRCDWTQEKFRISISDNGCGISDEMKPSIFKPSFTTKSKGSGLGLAMVKNIMQGFGGHVWFESEVNKGSTFHLEFIPLF